MPDFEKNCNYMILITQKEDEHDRTVVKHPIQARVEIFTVQVQRGVLLQKLVGFYEFSKDVHRKDLYDDVEPLQNVLENQFSENNDPLGQVMFERSV